MALEKPNQEKAALTCHMGLFNFQVMPFGWLNVPGVFPQLMSIILSGMEGFSMAYLDDVLVFSRTPEEHFQHLQIVFDRLRHRLKLKLPKCQFLREETKYLGFVSKLATIVEGDPKAPFSIATTPRCRGGRYSIPLIAPLYPWTVPYNAEC